MADLKELIKNAELAGALQAAKEQVKKHPANVNERWVLFDLLLVLGQWESAAKQLSVLRDLDKESATSFLLLEPLIQAERVREGVFKGAVTPHFLGEPAPWMSLLVEALKNESQGRHDAAAPLREQAFGDAPAIPGSVNGQPFAWLADADSRLGPILEAHVNAAYLWIPLQRIVKMEVEPPSSLRDFVWAKAYLQLDNGGTTAALIPTRYAGTIETEDPALMLARRTEWRETPGGAYHGIGQRLFATDERDLALLEIRSLAFAHGE